MTVKRINRGRGHSYEIDGKRADGVTTLIGAGLPKPALINWAAKTVAEHVADNLDSLEAWHRLGREGLVRALKGQATDRRNEAGVRGTEVHEIAERLTHGEEVPVPDRLAGHVEACVAFLNDFRVRPVITECVVASYEHNYCGTTDGVWDVETPEGFALPSGRYFGDFKTSGSGIWGETALQLAAYSWADVYLDANKEEQRIAELEANHLFALGVWIRADGYDVFPMPVTHEVFETFLKVVAVAREVDNVKSYKVDALPKPEWLGVTA